MLEDILIRVVVGGLTVSLFAVLADMMTPKSFAGLFSAAPSIALATIGLTVAKEGRAYASIEARSMILGAIAFVVYAALVSRILLKGKSSALSVSGSALSVWCAAAFGLWLAFLR
ncbi:MAG TPA: DUF3147 family protein [Terriglobales bacterium]|nr:DUF3147 family protein [Terriglobales bacterium]